MTRTVALAVLLALGAGCAEPTPACTVEDNGDGTRTVACSDGSRVTLPSGEGTCTLGVGEDGGKVIVCSDGTEVRIGPDGLPVFPGGGRVIGRVSLYGRDLHAGVTVRSRWTDEHTETAEDGSFRLDVKAGNHDLVFEHPDYDPLVVPAVPAVGPYLLPAVVLHPASRLGDDGAGYWPSPGEIAVALRPGGNRLAVRRGDTGADVSLSERASFPPAWDGDAALAFLEGQDPWSGEGVLVRHDLATGRRDELVPDATRVIAWPGGGLLYWRLDGTLDRLVRFTSAGGTVEFGPALRWTDARFTADEGGVFFETAVGVEWREADGRGGPLDGARSTWSILVAPAGPHAAFTGFDGRLRVLDRRDGGLVALGDGQPISFSPDGRRLLFWSGGVLAVYDVDTGSGDTLPYAGGLLSWADFTADGGVLVVSDGRVVLHRPGGAVETLADVAGAFVEPSPDRIRVLLLARDGGWQLHTVAGHAPPVSLDAADVPRFSGDGGHVVFRGPAGTFVKLAVGTGLATAFGEGAADVWPSPDGRLVLWTGVRDDRPILVAHELASGKEVRLASGAFDSFAFSPGGSTVAFRACGFTTCDLAVWSGGDAPRPVHDAVAGFDLRRRLLFYRFLPPGDHLEADRAGLWMARLPAP